jgi:hypothetical protein
MGGMGWNVKETATWNMGRQQAVNGRVVVTEYWPNALWKWEFVYGMESGYLDDNPANIRSISPSNAPYTDLDLLKGFYCAMKGGGTEFVYQPPDYQVVTQALTNPDANNNVELVHQIGGYPYNGSMVQVTEAVQVIDNASLIVYANGTPTGAYSLQAANSISPYQGIVLHFTGTPATPITATFNYYYLCRYSEDTQDYENFMAMLWGCSSVKIEQVRI